MRIALVTKRYPPDCCGVGDYTARLAESWEEQGHEVTVFVADRAKEITNSKFKISEDARKTMIVAESAKEITNSKFKISEDARKTMIVAEKAKEIANSKFKISEDVRKAEERSFVRHGGLRMTGSIRVVGLKLEGWGDIGRAVEAIREARPDALQIEYSNYGWSRWGFAFWMNRLVYELHRAGMPVTIALHEFPLTFAQAPLQAGISLLQRLHFWLLVLDANEALTNTHERVRILRRWFPWRRETIHYRPNSSNIPVAAGGAEHAAALRGQHASGAELVVTMFGQYHSNKHFEAAIEAASEMRRTVPLALWLLGDTSLAQPAYMERLRERIRERGLEDVTWWPGRMSPTEISQCLQASDIFVLPQPDGHLTRSGAFMAAAAHGLPVIAVRNAENQADFTHGENVWLVAESRADCIAQAMRELAGDAALRVRLGSNLRALYERKFAWEVAAARMTAVHETEAVHADV